uniref:RIIa domain-containing protein n=1 Tax=Sinocyclocheilus grahami TaxID=75366 RepID=A0A672LN05_SINGR
MAERSALEKLDLGALSLEQQEKLHQFKVKTRIANEQYLRSHPEVEMLLSDFLRSVFMFYVSLCLCFHFKMAES